MRFSVASVASAALSLGGPALAFIRATPDLPPSAYGYTYSGGPNISDYFSYVGPLPDKSFWIASFLHCDNGHDYAIVTTSAGVTVDPAYQISAVTFTDITEGTSIGRSYLTPGALSTTNASSDSGLLKVGAYSADQTSELYLISSIPEAVFNLTIVPKGPNLYQGGQSWFLWDDAVINAYDFPQCLPSGTITLPDGSVTNIIPDQSSTWFDLQWGPGGARLGWTNFVIILDNGVKALLLTTVADPLYRQSALATFLYPDGHHELYYVDPNLTELNPWQSSYSNATYYGDYVVNVPGKASFNVHVPVHGGDYQNNYTSSNQLADSFCTYEGMLDGVYVWGYGIVEHGVPVYSPGV